jgi:hypothetical protein
MNDRLYKDFSKRIITNEHFVNKKGHNSLLAKLSIHVTGYNYALLQSLSTYNILISINTKKRSLLSATKLYQ